MKDSRHAKNVRLKLFLFLCLLATISGMFLGASMRVLRVSAQESDFDGDADENGRVDSLDYSILFDHYTNETTRGHRDGDFNKSGKVNALDYVILFTFFGRSKTTPTPTVTPPPAQRGEDGACGESNDDWHHPTVILSDEKTCATGHDHGDEPPDWVKNSEWKPALVDASNVPGESSDDQHPFFKGYAMKLHGVDIYVLAHLNFTARGHRERFHSYRVWTKDKKGGISFWAGWMDFGSGDQEGPNLVSHCADGSIRPIMRVNYEDCEKVNWEAWFSAPGGEGQGGWAWDFGFYNCPQYYAGRSPKQEYDAQDRRLWKFVRGACKNNNRGIGVSWYQNRSTIRGTFWATQVASFGGVVSGPDDPVCGTTKSVGGRSYPVLCLEQHIAASMSEVSYPGNSFGKMYEDTGVSHPN